MYVRFFKPFLDVVVSAIALICLLPILLVLTVVGAIAMKGNPFFVQPRPGMIDKKTGKERIIPYLKFRSMSNAKDANGNLLPDEQRLGAYGKALRASSADELPSLINVVLLHCSICGPRPWLVRDCLFLTEKQRKRHTVRPGITGLAQVSGRNNITWEQRIEYDLKYVEEGITFIGDMKIIFQTIGKVLKRSDTVREGTVSDIDLGDWLLQEGKVTKEEYDRKQVEAKVMLGINAENEEKVMAVK